MKIILVSGLDAPADGNGLLDLRDKIIEKTPYNERINLVTKLLLWQDPLESADVYIAHSYGASSVIAYLRSNPDVKPKLVVLLDGVPEKSGEFWLFTQLGSKEWIIPPNVKRAVSFHRAAFFPPYSRPIQNKPITYNQDGIAVQFCENHAYFWATHNSIPRSAEIHQKILEML